MLKLGLKYEEELLIKVNGVDVKIKIEKNTATWCSVAVDAPVDVQVLRQSAKKREPVHLSKVEENG